MSATTATDELPAPRGRALDTASQARLLWLRFRRHKLAMAGLVVTVLIYLVAIFAELVAPFNPEKANGRLVFHPPQAIHWIDQTPAAGICGPMSTRSASRATR